MKYHIMVPYLVYINYDPQAKSGPAPGSYCFVKTSAKSHDMELLENEVMI